MNHSARPQIIAACPLVCLTACTSLTVVHPQSIHTTHIFGVPVIKVTPSQNALTVIRQQGIGVTSTSSGVTIGYVKETLATAPADERACGAVLIIEDTAQAESLLAHLQTNPQLLTNICVAKKD